MTVLPSSLRARLVVVVVVGVLPALAILLHLGRREYHEARQRLQADASRLVQAMAAHLGQSVEGGRQVLVALAALEQARGTDAAACTQVLQSLQPQYPQYANLGVLNPDGSLFASALPFAPTLSLGDRSWHQQVLQTRQFAVGEYQVGRLTGRQSVQLALPLLSVDQAQVRRVLFLALDLAWLGEQLRSEPVPPGATLTVLDRNGRVLARRPEPDRWVGQQWQVAAGLAQAQSRPENLARQDGLDQRPRLHAFAAVPGTGSALQVVVGIPWESALAPLVARSQQNMLFMLLGLLMALGAARWLGDRFLLQPLAVLEHTANRLAGGDFQARAALAGGVSELTRLGRVFDSMAAALQSHQAGRDLIEAQLETRVRERTAELEAANQELKSFSYSVSHDLRSPLRTIHGFSQVLIEDHAPQLDETGRGHLQQIRTASLQMMELIEQLLRLAQVSRAPLCRQWVDLSHQANGLLQELRRTDPDRAVQVQVSAGLKDYADPVLVGSVLRNLLANAWKFTSRQPQARIEFGRQPAADGQAPVYFVRDNGAGFDMDRASRLFGAFRRLHRAADFPGTGVGLATVARIIQRHGGRVWAEAQVGRGATFFFTLQADKTLVAAEPASEET